MCLKTELPLSVDLISDIDMRSLCKQSFLQYHCSHIGSTLITLSNKPKVI